MERRFAGLICLLMLLLVACNGGPTPLTGGVDLDLGDPNVGGGVGIVLPGETPQPLPVATSDFAPRPTLRAATVTTDTPPTDSPAPTDVPRPTVRPEPSATVAASAPTSEPDATPEPAVVDATAQPVGEAAAEAPPEATARPTTHIVAVGENLYRIGLQYGLSYVTLAEYNGITNYDQIAVGQELQIPPAEDATAEATATAVATEAVPEATAAPETTPAPQLTAEATISATPSAGQTHQVQPGENLYRISQQYGVSWVLIAEANGLISPNQITVGQVLKIPTNAPGPAPKITHQVRAGESLFRIALQYGVPLSAVVEANGLQVPYVIYPGQVLMIPGQGE